jgi:endonuclease/exonuclease/phosphatase family metal-dependent hydrolase
MWKVLCWNIRGFNSQLKWDALRDKIRDNQCDIICIQETKRELFDLSYIKNFCPSPFDCFEYLPSIGASGSIITIWKSQLFSGTLAFLNNFTLLVELTSKLNNQTWLLTNVYAPCTSERKRDFLNWFKSIQMPDNIDWLIVGDFNLLRSPANRNRPGGDTQEMFLFNAAISSLGLVELPLQGRKFTWSNKQDPPLLERLDWFFTSACWTLSYPTTSVSPLVMEPSDHVSCVISINTKIPKGKIFRFENNWMEHEHFMDIVAHGWNLPVFQTDKAKCLSAKFKNLRRVLKAWQLQLSNLKSNIDNVKLIMGLPDVLEEFRDLSVIEWNFRHLLQEKLAFCLGNSKFIGNREGLSNGLSLGMRAPSSSMPMQQLNTEGISLHLS